MLCDKRELTDLIHIHFSEDGLTSAQAITLVVSDSGPDHLVRKDDLTTKGLKRAESFERSIKSHCHASQHAFQIKKCSDASCFYCLEHLVRLPDSVFSTQTFLPLPLLEKSTKEHYQKYSDLYGQVPSKWADHLLYGGIKTTR